MSEAIINFAEIQKVLAPAFEGCMVRVVWDENEATVTVAKESGQRSLKAYGSLVAYADPSKIPHEKEAWAVAAVKKHDNS